MTKTVIGKAIIILMTVIFLMGCSVEPSKISNNMAQEMVNKITFAKQVESGLCFGVIASRKTGEASQSGLGLTNVPCDKVKHSLVK